MISAQAYLDLQESFLVVISLLGSWLRKIAKAQAYLDLHGIRRSHRTSLNMLLLRKMIQADGQWWQVDSRVAVPYVQTNIMSTVSDPQQVRSISKSTISPTFLQHFSNISPTSEVEQSGASLRAVITQFLPRRSTRFAKGGSGGTAASPRKGQGALRCQRCGEAVTVSWMQSASQIAWTNVVDGECWGCLMMFNDV